jgi:hypothetical protein
MAELGGVPQLNSEFALASTQRQLALCFALQATELAAPPPLSRAPPRTP